MRLLFSIFLLLLGTFSFAQQDREKIPFVAFWKKGESYDFQITKVKKEWEEDTMIKHDSSSYRVTFEVLDSTETSYKIKWKYKADLSPYNIPKDKIHEFSKYEINEVIYTTDELGQFQTIENWKELGAKMKELFLKVTHEVGKRNPTKKLAFEKSIQPLLQSFESKAAIEQFVFKEIQLFHFPFGMEYNVKDTLRYEDLLPNALSDKLIRSNAKLYFEKVDSYMSYCKIIHETKLNPDDTKEIIINLIRKMGLKDEEITNMVKRSKFDIRDYNKFAYYYIPGIPTNIETNRETIIDVDQFKARQVEKVMIEVLF